MLCRNAKFLVASDREAKVIVSSAWPRRRLGLALHQWLGRTAACLGELMGADSDCSGAAEVSLEGVKLSDQSWLRSMAVTGPGAAQWAGGRSALIMKSARKRANRGGYQPRWVTSRSYSSSEVQVHRTSAAWATLTPSRR